MGRKGSFVDNGGKGGIVAHIDMKSGKLDSDGLDTKGHSFTFHPDSGIPINGFQIPCWDKVISSCKEAMEINKKVLVCGWDVCILPNYEIELIEGNHAPDIFMMQAPLRKGLRKQVENIYRLYWKNK